MSQGYSGTPLFKKLGYKSGYRAHLVNAPETYLTLMPDLPEGVEFVDHPTTGSIDLVHLFTTSAVELATLLPVMCSIVVPAGMIWVSWPKKASRVRTDVVGDVVRLHAFPLGLVDIKVCAVTDVWSGLKLVIRKELRQK